MHSIKCAVASNEMITYASGDAMHTVAELDASNVAAPLIDQPLAATSVSGSQPNAHSRLDPNSDRRSLQSMHTTKCVLYLECGPVSFSINPL